MSPAAFFEKVRPGLAASLRPGKTRWMSVESVAIVVRACWERYRLSGREALVAVAVAVAGVVVVAVPATVAPKR
jgi:hypothetical protein